MDREVCNRRYEGLGDSDDGEGSSEPLIDSASIMLPKDKYQLTFIIFYLLGLGSLLPWNFFITANDYWMYKLRDVNETAPQSTTTSSPLPMNVTTVTLDSGTSYNRLQSIFPNCLALCAMLPNVLFQFLNTVLQKHISINARVIGTLALMIVLFVVTEIFVKVDVTSWRETFFVVTLITVVLINSLSAIFQSSVFGLAARFPQKYSGSIMAGQGMGGVFAAVAMIVALSCSNSPTDSAFVFFMTAIAVLLLTLALYRLLVKLDFYCHYFYEKSQESSEVTPINGEVHFEEKAPCLERNGCDLEVDDRSKSGKDLKEDETCLNSSSNYEINIKQSKFNAETSIPYCDIIRKIGLHMFCIVYTFFITLACFPAVTALIKSVDSGTAWNDVYFTPVCCFLFFNLSDWLGRTAASYIHFPSARRKIALLCLVLARSVFPFLFALCNVQPRFHLPVVFNKDFYFILFMCLFGFSNGHLSTLCMQYGPKQVDLEHATTAGSLLAFMISVGLLTGAGASFLLKMLI